MQVMVGKSSFGEIEEWYKSTCNSRGWRCPLPNNSHGRTFCHAFKMHIMITLLNGSRRPLGCSLKVPNYKDSRGKTRDGTEGGVAEVVERLDLGSRTEQFFHGTMAPGCCGGFCGQPASWCVVGDAMEVCLIHHCPCALSLFFVDLMEVHNARGECISLPTC